MKKFIAGALAFATALTVLTGCGGAAGSSTAQTSGSTAAGSTAAGSTASGEQQVLKVATWDYTSNPSVSNSVKAFEAANSNIKIEILDIPSTDYNTKLNVMLNGGSDLDAYFIKDASSTYDLYKKNQLLDLTDYIEADGVDMSAYNGTDTPFNIEGRQYGMPVRTDYYVLFYNKDLFDAANMEYPSNDMTWSEFEDLAMQISEAADCYGAYFHTWQACVQNWGVQDGEHTIMDYDTNYDFFKPYYEMALRLQDAGAIQEFGELQSGNIHYSGAFAAGNVAMMPMGTWYMATIAESIKNGEANLKEWGVAPLPHPDNVSAGYTVGATTPIVINPASQKQDLAWQFVKFMSGEESANEYAKVGAIPGRLNDEILALVQEQEGMPEGLAEALKVENIVADRPIQESVTEVNDMLGQEHSLIMLKECSVDEGLANMGARAAEILK